MGEFLQKVNPFGIGAAFLDYCINQKWIVTKMDEHQLHYYLTAEGEAALHSNFGIVLNGCAKLED
ncbi:MAG TPA: hypothetical protein DCY20_09300 [Firmicutes bacterium]|nr:hypothetical protein [Bacillota bacterium]